MSKYRFELNVLNTNSNVYRSTQMHGLYTSFSCRKVTIVQTSHFTRSVMSIGLFIKRFV